MFSLRGGLLREACMSQLTPRIPFSPVSYAPFSPPPLALRQREPTSPAFADVMLPSATEAIHYGFHIQIFHRRQNAE